MKEEVGKLKAKYNAKKKELEVLRSEFEGSLRDAMKENRMREANSTLKNHCNNTTLSEVDYEEVIKENEDKFAQNEKVDQDKQRIIQQYEIKIKKVESELSTMRSKTGSEVTNTLQTFVEIIMLELDKLLKHINAGGKGNSQYTDEINKTIAKLVLSISADGKCGEYLEAFKVKLNSVLITFKRTIESQYKPCEPLLKTVETKAQFSSEENDQPNMPSIKVYFEAMDEGYEKNVLTKICPIRNSHGKYVVDIEKVARDLLLVKESLYSVFIKANCPVNQSFNSDCTILTELSKLQTAGTDTERALDNIAREYRNLLNVILRFAVEAAWVVRGGQNKDSKSSMVVEQEEFLKLKLINADLKEQLSNIIKEKNALLKKVSLFTGESSQLVC